MLALLPLILAAAADTIELRPGMVITRSAVVRPGVYRLRPVAPDTAAIRIRGKDIVLEMAGVTLAGTDQDEAPDRARGIGLLIEAGERVTVTNARIRGYRIGILVRGTRRLTLAGNDVSHNWKPRLWSGLGHESLVDWLYFHHNEQDEWFRYGAGIFLIDVRGGEIRGNVARQGMNGLQLVRTERVRVWNNDFSWLSGLGIGLYRASHNVIMHNRLDYCVRGYVHGVYRRGQDSAALLLYEQSSHNVVAYNSMTHSGDGVFLWAGQHTMDTGQGGANDNLFFGNDVSFAVANGIEATFSRNRFIGNLSEGSEYGVWGGYSWGSEIRDNTFRRNVTAIAIEHGQDNVIAGNTFLGDTTAIRLWWNRIEPSDWGYPRHRDTRSRGYRIEGNHFTPRGTTLRIENTEAVTLARNDSAAVDQPWAPDVAHRSAPKPMPGGMLAMLPLGALRGRETILVDEWGPYDGLSPKLWPARLADSAYTGGPLTLRTLGPPGRWRVVTQTGVDRLSDSAGVIGDTLRVTPAAGPVTDWRVELEYVGGAVTSPAGAHTPAGAPYRFAYERFVAPADWTVRVIAWDSTTDPRTQPEAFRAPLSGPVLVTRQDAVLDYMWSRPRLPGFPGERFGVIADGTVDLPAGDYELVTISDDGIRVWVDDALVIDRWLPHESELATAPLTPGRHRLRVEYYQVDGWVELRVEARRRP